MKLSIRKLNLYPVTLQYKTEGTVWGENISARGIPNRDLINTILMKKDNVYERLSKAEREQLEQLEKEHPYVDLLTDAVPIRYGT